MKDIIITKNSFDVSLNSFNEKGETKFSINRRHSLLTMNRQITQKGKREGIIIFEEILSPKIAPSVIVLG